MKQSRPDVWRLGRDIAVVLLLLSLIVWLVWQYVPAVRHGYDDGILVKHQALQSSTSPKIVFVGGSNLSYGLDSQAVEHALDRPVVNMGINATIGLPVQLSDIEYQLKSGDMVVIVPEHETLRTTVYNNANLANSLLNEPSALGRLIEQRDFSELYSVMRSVPFAVSRKVRFHIESSVRPGVGTESPEGQLFNRYGDYIAHLSSSETMEHANIEQSAASYINDSRPLVSDAVLNDVNTFYQQAEDNGVTIVMMYPCLIDAYYTSLADTLQSVHAHLQEDLEIPLLNSPGSCVLPANQFYDTTYHLTADGRQYRTEYVITILQELQSDPAF